ncbi:MAG: thiamine pyrophosphate-dependent enzyme [Candidatus Brocadiaceae bacterium]
MDIKDFKSNDEIAWCPGRPAAVMAILSYRSCHFKCMVSVKKRPLVELNKPPKDILLVSGIGQAAKLPHYVRCNCFNGLHGRALPVAAAAKIANRELTVIVTTGDGDCYGEVATTLSTIYEGIPI